MSAPLSADAFIRALKAEGLSVHEHANWRSHTRSGSGRPWGPVHGVMMHHTASGTSGIVEYCYRGSSALPGPLCHGVIDKTGLVTLVGYGRTNHAGGGDRDVLNAVIAESYATNPPATHEHQDSDGAVDGNKSFYGFEAVNHGDGKDPWPVVQYEAMVKAAAAICRVHAWTGKSAIGHKEWSDQKSDPKAPWTMATFRHDVAACLAKKPGAWHIVPEPEVKLTVEQRLDRIEKKLGLD
jgi:hypothetical protein